MGRGKVCRTATVTPVWALVRQDPIPRAPLDMDNREEMGLLKSVTSTCVQRIKLFFFPFLKSLQMGADACQLWNISILCWGGGKVFHPTRGSIFSAVPERLLRDREFFPVKDGFRPKDRVKASLGVKNLNVKKAFLLHFWWPGDGSRIPEISPPVLTKIQPFYSHFPVWIFH